MLPPKKVLPLTMLHAAAKLHIFKRSSARSSLLLLLAPPLSSVGLFCEAPQHSTSMAWYRRRSNTPRIPQTQA